MAVCLRSEKGITYPRCYRNVDQPRCEQASHCAWLPASQDCHLSRDIEKVYRPAQKAAQDENHLGLANLLWSLWDEGFAPFLGEDLLPIYALTRIDNWDRNGHDLLGNVIVGLALMNVATDQPRDEEEAGLFSDSDWWMRYQSASQATRQKIDDLLRSLRDQAIQALRAGEDMEGVYDFAVGAIEPGIDPSSPPSVISLGL